MTEKKRLKSILCASEIKQEAFRILTDLNIFDKVYLGAQNAVGIGKNIASISIPNQSFDIYAQHPRSYATTTALLLEVVITEKKDIESELSQVTDEIVRALHKDLTLSGLVEQISLEQIETEQDKTSEKNLGFIKLSFTLLHTVYMPEEKTNHSSAFTGVKIAI